MRASERVELLRDCLLVRCSRLVSLGGVLRCFESGVLAIYGESESLKSASCAYWHRHHVGNSPSRDSFVVGKLAWRFLQLGPPAPASLALSVDHGAAPASREPRGAIATDTNPDRAAPHCEGGVAVGRGAVLGAGTGRVVRRRDGGWGVGVGTLAAGSRGMSCQSKITSGHIRKSSTKANSPRSSARGTDQEVL